MAKIVKTLFKSNRLSDPSEYYISVLQKDIPQIYNSNGDTISIKEIHCVKGGTEFKTDAKITKYVLKTQNGNKKVYSKRENNIANFTEYSDVNSTFEYSGFEPRNIIDMKFNSYKYKNETIKLTPDLLKHFLIQTCEDLDD